MISNNGIKRKSSSSSSSIDNGKTTHLIPSTRKRFRAATTTPTVQHGNNEHRMTVDQQAHASEMTPPVVLKDEYRQLQYELQCQEALLILMQKLRANQQLTSNHGKQQTAAVHAAKVNTPAGTNATVVVVPPKQSLIRSKPSQHSVHRSNHHAPSANFTVPSVPHAARQPTNSNVSTPTATRISSAVPPPPSSIVKHSPQKSLASHPRKSNDVVVEQTLLNAKLALRKQLEQTLLQIPTPKPSICEVTFIPGMNGWSDFLTVIGQEQAFTTYSDIINRRLSPDVSLGSPYVCAHCGTDWSVTWHEVRSADETNPCEKILCDRCRKSSQRKLLKQDHSNRLRQAFIKALQQEKELETKFQSNAPPIKAVAAVPTPPPKHSSKPSTKTHTHHPPPTTTKVSSKTHAHKAPSISNPFSMEALAALQAHEQLEYFQKHFLSKMFPFPVPDQLAAAAAALTSKSLQQQQQQQQALAASLLQQQNPSQYLLDMIPQANKPKQRHHRSQ